MQQPVSRPRVFVSSTIRDFRDLRSALKYWLKEQGLDVRMSEFNDFPRRPDDGTFESCFSAIEDCDYYILLVGSSKGSEYTRGVSVTQQEYRIAASLAKQGRIKPVLFVPAEVSTALGERKALLDASADEDNIQNATSAVLHDPAFVASFVDEIKQTESLRTGTDGPPGKMWYYTFSSFEELVDALRINLRLHRPIPRQALLANLKWEIEENVAALVSKRDELPIPLHSYLRPVRSKVKLVATLAIRHARLTCEQARNVAAFWLTMPSGQRLKVMALREAVFSGVADHGNLPGRGRI